jgi:hypothetical protein
LIIEDLGLMATMEQMTQMLTAVQAQGLEAMRMMAQQQHAAMQELLAGVQQQRPRPEGGMTDTRGVGRPINFKGEETKFAEWVAKLQAYIRVNNPEAGNWLKWASDKTVSINDELICEEFDDMWIEEVQKFSHRLFATIISCTEEDAFRLANSVNDQSGLEAYRLLKKRYEPKTPGTKRALLKSIINNPQSKRVQEVEANLMKIEDLMKKYESIATEKLPEDLKVTVIMDLCHKELREHLELSTKDVGYKDVRDEIVNYVERKRDMINTGVKAMEVDHLCYEHQWSNDDDYAYEPEELSWISKGGHGKGYGKGKGKNMQFTTKGYGKGEYGKGEYGKGEYGKGDSKGKGKGKGKGFQGNCHWCGEWGHSASRCADKDKYMQGVREHRGEEEGHKGKGKGAYNIEEWQADTTIREVEALEAQQGWRTISNIEVANRFQLLENNDVEYDEQWPEVTMKCPEKFKDKAKEKKQKKLCWRKLEGPPGLCCRNPVHEVSSLEISHVDEQQGHSRQMMSLTMDSGAAETVTNQAEAPEYDVLVPHGPERNTQYILPSGELIPNRGEKHVKVRTKEGAKCLIRMQVTDVRKSLMSVGKVCDEGHRVIFEQKGGYIEHIETGDKTKFWRKGGVYVLDVELEPNSGFRGQGK